MKKEYHDYEQMRDRVLLRDTIKSIIGFLGDDPDRSGVLETPDRVLKSWDTLYAGYKKNPADVFKVFDEGYDEMVVIDNIQFFSTCEHHMLPFFGKAHIGYLPKNGKVLGASKLSRLLDVFSRRLQIQERLGKEVVEALMKYLQPEGAGCIIEAQHLCMMARGIEKQQSVMVTSSLAGCFKQLDVKTEFLNLINRNRK